jgi:hypothetical protein
MLTLKHCARFASCTQRKSPRPRIERAEVFVFTESAQIASIAAEAILVFLSW